MGKGLKGGGGKESLNVAGACNGACYACGTSGITHRYCQCNPKRQEPPLKEVDQSEETKTENAAAATLGSLGGLKPMAFSAVVKSDEWKIIGMKSEAELGCLCVVEPDRCSAPFLPKGTRVGAS